jgi:hypothetical protein
MESNETRLQIADFGLKIAGKRVLDLQINDLQFHPWELSGGEGIRTLDLLNAIQPRSQLRHAPKIDSLPWFKLPVPAQPVNLSPLPAGNPN